MTYVRPTEEQIRRALSQHAPHLVDAPLTALGEGWGSWAFRLGDYVIRVAKSEGAVGRVLMGALERPLAGPPRRPDSLRVDDTAWPCRRACGYCSIRLLPGESGGSMDNGADSRSIGWHVALKDRR